MRHLALVLVLAALGGCGEPPAKGMTAAKQCRQGYDRLMRWVTGRGRYPTTDEEWNSVGLPDDLWGNPLEVTMDEGEARVWSAGPDGEAWTDDDLCYPPLD